MQTPESSLETLTERVGQLERQYNSLKSEMVTQKLLLVDSDGKTRAALRMSEGVPSLILYDTNMNVRAVLRVNDDGSALHLLDADTKLGLELRVSDSGPDVSLFDAEGKQRLTLAVTGYESGTPHLGMWNANGMSSVVVTTLDNGPSIALIDPANADGNTGVRLTVDTKEGASLSCYKEGKAGVWLYADEKGPSLRCSKEGKVLWAAP